MYHWEADQEDFLVLAGEAVLVVEGVERPLRRWDFVHCPAGTKHVIVGRGGVALRRSSPSARATSRQAPTGAATRWRRRRSGSVPASSTRPPTRRRPTRSYPEREPTRYHEGWLPD